MWHLINQFLLLAFLVILPFTNFGQLKQPEQSWLDPSDAEFIKAVDKGFANVKARSPFRSIELKSPLTDSTRNVNIVIQSPLDCAFQLGQIHAADLRDKPELVRVKSQCAEEITVLVVEETQNQDEHWRMKLEIEGQQPEVAEPRGTNEPRPKQYTTLTDHKIHFGYKYDRIFSFYPESVPSKARLRYTDGTTPTVTNLDFTWFAEDELKARKPI